MDRYKVLELLLTVSVLCCLCHGWDVQVPESVTAVEGTCVMVPCQTSPHNRVIWYKYKRVGYPVVYSRETADILDEFRGRTSVPGNPSEGNCTLKINSVRPGDEGVDVYAWINPDTSSQRFYDKTTTINVVKPEIFFSTEGTEVDGKLFSATCTVRHSCPSPPRMEWVGLSCVRNVVTNTVNDRGLWTSVARAQFKPNRQDHGKILSCMSTLSDKTIYSQSSHQLNVLYAPVNVQINGADGKDVVEGASVSLTCISSSNPSPTSYEWRVTHLQTTKNYKASRTFSLPNVRRNMSVTCIVQNTVGQGESGEVFLKVHFSPTIQRDSLCTEWATEGKCVCRAEAEPKAKILWRVNGSIAVFPHFNTTTKYVGRISVSELTGPLTPRVSCVASNYLGTDTYQIPIRRPLLEASPIIQPDSECSGWASGMQCVCRVEAEPKADILWRVNGSRVLLPHFNTTSKYVGRVTVSELTGPLAHNVSCEASNFLGTVAYQMPLRLPVLEGNLVMILAAVAVVVCVILGIAVVAVCLRKRSCRKSSGDSTKNPKPGSMNLNMYNDDRVGKMIYDNDNYYNNDTEGQGVYNNSPVSQNDSVGEDLYNNTVKTPHVNEDDGCEIYENY